MIHENCACIQCKEADRPCHYDCAVEDMCLGCYDAWEDIYDIQYEIDLARGLK